MLQKRQASPGLPFFSLLFTKEEQKDQLRLELDKLGLTIHSEWAPSFNPLKDYYEKEMGAGLWREIWVCLGPVARERLIGLKNWALELEGKSASGGKRSLNIDPGLILPEQLVLATTKPYSHRIYVQDGVFIELCYRYENKSYQFLPWTYPDYQDSEKIEFFNSLRSLLFL